ncbi:MAG: glycosyltransferase family 2 protein, partial [Clostridiales bacterium]|nr:glycosyltransferase family 2 protein [Clostridiales bacterium]
MIVPSNTPLVTVIIPAYNRFEEVQRAIDSVIRQTYKEVEIILVDDYSTKSLISLENKYNGLKVIRHPSNLGSAAARNTGFKAANGKYIALLDSDDLWLGNKIEIQVNYMETHPNVDITTTGYFYYTDEGDSVIIPKHQKNWHHHFCTGGGLAAGSTLVAKKKCLLDIQYDVNLRRLTDIDLLLR